MRTTNQLVIFTINKQLYALYLATVERITRIVEITPLPKIPEIIIGVVNVQGQIIPVVNTRKRLNLPERDIDLSDQLIIAKTPNRVVALVVDTVIGIIDCSIKKVIESENILHNMEYIKGIVKLEDNMILIYDLNKFLSLEEETMIAQALE